MCGGDGPSGQWRCVGHRRLQLLFCLVGKVSCCSSICSEGFVEGKMCWGSCSVSVPQGLSGVEEVSGIDILCCLRTGVPVTTCRIKTCLFISFLCISEPFFLHLCSIQASWFVSRSVAISPTLCF